MRWITRPAIEAALSAAVLGFSGWVVWASLTTRPF